MIFKRNVSRRKLFEKPPQTFQVDVQKNEKRTLGLKAFARFLIINNKDYTERYLT